MRIAHACALCNAKSREKINEEIVQEQQSAVLPRDWFKFVTGLYEVKYV